MNIYNKKGDITTHKIITALIVLAVILVVLLFIFKANIGGYLKNLIPDFSVSEEDAVVDELPSNVERVELKDDCVKEAFWVDKSKILINENKEIQPGEIFISVKISNINTCSHSIIIESNVEKEAKGIIITSSSLKSWEKIGDLYFKKYSVKDAGLFKSGEYTFKVNDNSGKTIHSGYKILVED